MGVALRAQGRLDEAAQAFTLGLEAQDDVAELRLNLAATLTQLEQYDQARTEYAKVLAMRPSDACAHWALYELEQVAGNRKSALAHQSAVLDQQTIFTVQAPRERRRLIALMAPGDWQANVPVDYLVDAQTTTLHKVYLTAGERASPALPPADAIFTAIAYSPQNAGALARARDIVQRSQLPVINDPSSVARTERAAVYAALDGMRFVRVPQTRKYARAALESAGTFAFPLVIRPIGSQAGRDFERITGAAGLHAYLSRVSAAAFYVMPFIDYASSDGYYRKYRIFVVAGTPYPCHLGISEHWMVHYYNAPMREHAWMREEERRFLEQFETVFDERLREGMSRIAGALGLDYTGLDCTIDRDGALLVFEADPAMIVHAADELELFAHKHAAARAIFAAFSRLVDDARSR
ncbi:MAG: tetratricopeptide repeat protein [Candidatus Baltobacteraceae bacterium]